MFSITYNKAQLDVVIRKLNKARAIASGGIFGMMPALGRLAQWQIRRRILVEKESPDGDEWKPNIRGNPTLVMSGALAKSISASSTMFTTRITANTRYARIQNFGGTMRGNMYWEMNGQFYHATSVTLPARPYMGLSSKNLTEIYALADQYMRRGFGWLWS